MSLTITIDRTENGHFRAEVDAHPLVVIEGSELSEWLDELKQTLDLIAVAPDGTLSIHRTETEDAAARAEVEKTALRNQELDELIDRYPVPAEWGDEPGWADVLETISKGERGA